jgi:hypothetical protein
MTKGRNGQTHGRLADMSIPPDLRLIKSKPKKIGGTPPAQMDHNSQANAKKGKRRKGKR